jgi:hypothetical protein
LDLSIEKGGVDVDEEDLWSDSAEEKGGPGSDYSYPSDT